MDPVELRRALRQQLGDERFRKFIDVLNTDCMRKRRFTHWQSEIWKAFVKEHPEADLPFDKVQLLLRICPLHDCLLETPGRCDPEPPFRVTTEYETAAKSLFPYWGMIIQGGIHPSGRATVFEVCPRCDDARKRWIAEHTRVSDCLVRQTTVDDFCSNLDPAVVQAAEPFRTAREQIDRELLAGGELWEFDCGGWDIGEGISGLAVVREGRIVKWWMLVFGDRDEAD